MSPNADLDPLGRPASGFRLIGCDAAPIAAELAVVLDPDPTTADELPILTNRQADAIGRLDEVAARCPVNSARSHGIGQHRDPALRFALGCDVATERRWRAIVLRAFARADAVAWCEGNRRLDGRYLTERAEDMARCRNALLDLMFCNDLPETILKHRAGNELPRDWVADLNRAAETLEQYETIAKGLAARFNPRGAPRVIARTHFVLRIAAAYAVLTGDVPQFDGGNDDDAHDDHGQRKRPENRRWHDLITAALDVADIRGDQQVNSILNHARQGPLIGDVERIRWIAHQEPREFWRIEVGSWPATGLEIDVGLDVRRPPETREEAYEHPRTRFAGTGRLGRHGK